MILVKIEKLMYLNDFTLSLFLLITVEIFLDTVCPESFAEDFKKIGLFSDTGKKKVKILISLIKWAYRSKGLTQNMLKCV